MEAAEGSRGGDLGVAAVCFGRGVFWRGSGHAGEWAGLDGAGGRGGGRRGGGRDRGLRRLVEGRLANKSRGPAGWGGAGRYGARWQ